VSARTLLLDGMGSVRQATNSIGSITDELEYDVFGQQLSRSGNTEIDHLYRGEQVNPNTGYYNLRARWYDPRNGRFISQDSFLGHDSDPASLHKYVYGGSDPANRSDPSGRAFLDQMTATRVVAILAAATIAVTAHTMSITNLDATGDRQPGVWEGVAIPQFRAKAQSETEVVPVVRTRVKRKDTEGHHTVPVYLCGAVEQETVEISESDHDRIHLGLAGVYVAKVSAENYADKVVFGGRRTPGIVSDLALTGPGRRLISGKTLRRRHYVTSSLLTQ
jgi:RHS repeat-associated protein